MINQLSASQITSATASTNRVAAFPGGASIVKAIATIAKATTARCGAARSALAQHTVVAAHGDSARGGGGGITHRTGAAMGDGGGGTRASAAADRPTLSAGSAIRPHSPTGGASRAAHGGGAGCAALADETRSGVASGGDGACGGRGDIADNRAGAARECAARASAAVGSLRPILRPCDAGGGATGAALADHAVGAAESDGACGIGGAVGDGGAGTMIKHAMGGGAGGGGHCPIRGGCRALRVASGG